MKVSRNSKYQTHKKISNSRITRTTDLARQVSTSAGPCRAKRGILSNFLTSIVAKHQKIEGGGDPLRKVFFSEKSLTMSKKLKGGPFSLSWYGMLRGKGGKTILVQFARPNDSIWDHKIL